MRSSRAPALLAAAMAAAVLSGPARSSDGHGDLAVVATQDAPLPDQDASSEYADMHAFLCHRLHAPCDVPDVPALRQRPSSARAAAARAGEIGSVSGRLVDAVSGEPITVTLEDFDVGDERDVDLFYCGDSTDPADCELASYEYPDLDGRFVFNREFLWFDTPPGYFMISFHGLLWGVIYQSSPFQVGAGEHLDLGDIPIQPFRLLTSGFPCAGEVESGGRCVVPISVANISAGRFIGSLWAEVEIDDPSLHRTFTTRFQVGTGGPDAPLPRTVVVGPGATRGFPLAFGLTGALSDGSRVCITPYLGRGRRAQQPRYDMIGIGRTECHTKGGR